MLSRTWVIKYRVPAFHVFLVGMESLQLHAQIGFPVFDDFGMNLIYQWPVAPGGILKYTFIFDMNWVEYAFTFSTFHHKLCTSEARCSQEIVWTISQNGLPETIRHENRC